MYAYIHEGLPASLSTCPCPPFPAHPPFVRPPHVSPPHACLLARTSARLPDRLPARLLACSPACPPVRPSFYNLYASNVLYIILHVGIKMAAEYIHCRPEVRLITQPSLFITTMGGRSLTAGGAKNCRVLCKFIRKIFI